MCCRQLQRNVDAGEVSGSLGNERLCPLGVPTGVFRLTCTPSQERDTSPRTTILYLSAHLTLQQSQESHLLSFPLGLWGSQGSEISTNFSMLTQLVCGRGFQDYLTSRWILLLVPSCPVVLCSSYMLGCTQVTCFLCTTLGSTQEGKKV